MDGFDNSVINGPLTPDAGISQGADGRTPIQDATARPAQFRQTAADRTDAHRQLSADEPAAPNIGRSQRDADVQGDMEISPQTGSDEAESLLVEQARKDPAAFGAVYERYIDRIYGYIFHRVGNVHDAEDLTARTFYRALDKLHTYQDRGLPFSAWLFRIAHNLVANWHRDRSRRRFLSLDRIWNQSQQTDTPEEKVVRDERHAALWSAINRLPKERKNLLLYKFGSMLSNIEIGDLMGKSESAIKSLYFRTLSALRTDLESRGWDAAMNDAMEALGAHAKEGGAETGGQTDEGA